VEDAHIIATNIQNQ